MLKSLLLAAEVDGKPHFIGRVGSGIPPAVHLALLGKFSGLSQRQPSLPCDITQARWLRPELVCRVSFMEWTNAKKLRAPVFERLL